MPLVSLSELPALLPHAVDWIALLERYGLEGFLKRYLGQLAGEDHAGARLEREARTWTKWLEGA